MTSFSIPLARYKADEIDLDQRILDQEAGSPDRRARGWHGEVILPHLVERMEVVEIGEEHLRLEDVIER